MLDGKDKLAGLEKVLKQAQASLLTKQDPKVSTFPWHRSKEAKEREKETLEFFEKAPEDCFIKHPNHADWQEWLQTKGYTSLANQNRDYLRFSIDKYFTYLMNRPNPTPVIVEKKPDIPHQPTPDSFKRIYESLAKFKSKETPV